MINDMTAKAKVKIKKFDPKDSEKDSEAILRSVKEKIKFHVTRNKPNTLSELIRLGKFAPKFFEFRHVCLKCGELYQMGSYEIAQNAMGHEVIFTCDCGHKTILPQS